ncbi:4-diphosphocytidyl-2-C-methyl-D-erythritol kinase, chloroplastic [Nymphaea colorata]|nr:4-diphosphocytidyl-2-C-methyl-D-erythritol kinase, chloroplastic [Nymphaea colorata]
MISTNLFPHHFCFSIQPKDEARYCRKFLFPMLTSRSSRFRECPFPRIVCSDSKSERRQIEIVYDPDERINRLADEVDKQAGLSRLTLFSPCKINVFLRITSRRDDGYHDLASLFHVISLGDTIKFSLSPTKSRDRLSTNVPGIPLDESNLIIKALNLYRKKTGTDNYFWIHLDKKVPSGAGLGGGSSNAATALWAANQFTGGIATEKELQEWSSEIGSDIPFFFSHGAAYCTGRGEVVQDIPSPIPMDMPLVLIKPQEACPTGEVYRNLRLDQTSSADPLSLLEKIRESGFSQDVCINDLESPAFVVLPSLKKLKQRILAAGRGQYAAVFMSGSGSTIVGVGDPDPPQFIYDDDEYQNVFVSEAYFLTRRENEWYTEPISPGATPCNDSSDSKSAR